MRRYFRKADFQNDGMVLGRISVRVRLARRSDDGDRTKAQRRRYNRDRIGCGTDEIHIQRSYRRIQYSSVARRTHLRDRRTETGVQRRRGKATTSHRRVGFVFACSS